jgi:hypothetical protein
MHVIRSRNDLLIEISTELGPPFAKLIESRGMTNELVRRTICSCAVEDGHGCVWDLAIAASNAME